MVTIYTLADRYYLRKKLSLYPTYALLLICLLFFFFFLAIFLQRQRANQLSIEVAALKYTMEEKK